MGAAVTYPTDLVKTRLMNQRRTKAYQDSLDCVSKVTAGRRTATDSPGTPARAPAGSLPGPQSSGQSRPGVAAIELTPQLLSVATGSATKLATNDFVRDRLTSATHGHMTLGGGLGWRAPPWPGEVLAGAMAGAANGLLSSPLELVKLRLQVVGRGRRGGRPSVQGSTPSTPHTPGSVCGGS